MSLHLLALRVAAGLQLVPLLSHIRCRLKLDGSAEPVARMAIRMLPALSESRDAATHAVFDLCPGLGSRCWLTALDDKRQLCVHRSRCALLQHGFSLVLADFVPGGHRGSRCCQWLRKCLRAVTIGDVSSMRWIGSTYAETGRAAVYIACMQSRCDCCNCYNGQLISRMIL